MAVSRESMCYTVSMTNGFEPKIKRAVMTNLYHFIFNSETKGTASKVTVSILGKILILMICIFLVYIIINTL